jgi:large subunit ribosomal protein L32e
MGSIKPLNKFKMARKTRKRFVRHQAALFVRIKAIKWRKQKGIDSRVRRRFKGQILQPKIGYGTDKKWKHVLPNGFKKFRVNNVAELEVLMMSNKTYCAEIASAVGVQKRKAILERAAQLNIRVINPNTKLNAEEAE